AGAASTTPAALGGAAGSGTRTCGWATRRRSARGIARGPSPSPPTARRRRRWCRPTVTYNAKGLAGRKYLLPAMWDPRTRQCKASA
ncbi:unnamed protein product, partial [Musa acuminata subsp. burmannicoides]